MTFGWLPAAREFCTLPDVFSNPPQGKIRHLFRGALLAVIASVIIPVLLDASFRPLAPASLMLYGLFVVYCVVMMHGVGWAKAVLPRAWAWPFFGGMLGLFALFYLVADPSYTVWILAMPVVSLAAATVRLRWAILVAAACLAVQAGFLVSKDVEWRAISTSTISWSVGMVFTLACTELAVWANASRERAEQLTRELEAANAELRSAAERTAALAAATERNRIARDIHDGLGHYLTVVAVQLQAARALLPAQPERAAAVVAKAEQAARHALDDVRRSVGALREPTNRPPLPVALEGLVRESGLAASFVCAGEVRRLGEAAEQALFRAVQEGLTNVRKHAGPARAAVVLDYRGPGGVAVEVTDNGAGGAVSPGSGFGLAGLRERLAAVGGSLSAGRAPAGGFRLRAEVAA